MRYSISAGLLTMIVALLTGCFAGPNSSSTPNPTAGPSTISSSSQADSSSVENRYRKSGHHHHRRHRSHHRRRHRHRHRGHSPPAPSPTRPDTAAPVTSEIPDRKSQADTGSVSADSESDTISELVSRGRRLYDRNCSACHGPELRGSPPQFPSLVNVQKRRTRGQILDLLRNGRKAMPSFSYLPETDREALVAFLLQQPDE